MRKIVSQFWLLSLNQTVPKSLCFVYLFWFFSLTCKHESFEGSHSNPTSLTSTPHLDFSTQGESGKIWGRTTLSLGCSFFSLQVWQTLVEMSVAVWVAVSVRLNALSGSVWTGGCCEYAIWATEHYTATNTTLIELQSTTLIQIRDLSYRALHSATNPYIVANDGRQPQGANGATM